MTTASRVVHVIEDDEAARDALTFLLRAADFEVRAYESAIVFLESRCYGGGGEEIASIAADASRWSPQMQKLNDLSQCRIVLQQDSTLIAVIEMSLSSWLVAGIVPGVERQPLKKFA